MTRGSKIFLLRAGAWLCLALAGYCAFYALRDPEDLGYLLLGLPPVMVAMLARLEMQRLDASAGLLPGRRTVHVVEEAGPLGPEQAPTGQ